MRWAALATVVPASAVFVALVTASAPAAPAPTADQQLAASFETARTSARAAIRSLAQPTRTSTKAARDQLRAGATALATASKIAPRAVGALAAPAITKALARAGRLLGQARSDVAAGRHEQASTKALTALDLVTAAIGEFGLPLEREFSVYAVDRDFRQVRGFTDYSGFTASASEEVTHVIIGAADRETANAAEPAGKTVETGDGLPITQMSVYIIRDPLGRFTSNWCELADGLITCKLNPTLRPDHTYTIAFGPKLSRGTDVLVKFRTRAGRRSYSVFTTR